jgi:hypothetical protein
MAVARRWQSLPPSPTARSHRTQARDIRHLKDREGGNDA